MELKPIGKKIVIIGGGLVGIETAMHLNNHFPDRKITVLESLSEPLSDVVRVTKLAMAEKLQKTSIDIIAWVNILRITDSEVQYLDSDRRLKAIPYDTVVLAAGFVPKTNLEVLTDGIKVEVHTVGDCLRPGKILNAIDFAAILGSKI